MPRALRMWHWIVFAILPDLAYVCGDDDAKDCSGLRASLRTQLKEKLPGLFPRYAPSYRKSLGCRARTVGRKFANWEEKVMEMKNKSDGLFDYIVFSMPREEPPGTKNWNLSGLTITENKKEELKNSFYTKIGCGSAKDKEGKKLLCFLRFNLKEFYEWAAEQSDGKNLDLPLGHIRM
ncbi:unnamed protein product [Cylicocyclus nassatus]|uniref:Uncharacterized protein n=1 Tax=Cylicocyclus nassatus TaxID=53992 RepID=A0AA36GHH7_CYLNA|nr:unnamed protein product [Cylicocyclus nassatus]